MVTVKYTIYNIHNIIQQLTDAPKVSFFIDQIYSKWQEVHCAMHYQDHAVGGAEVAEVAEHVNSLAWCFSKPSLCDFDNVQLPNNQKKKQKKRS